VVLFELPNGLRLLVKENHRLPFIDFRAVLRGGVLGESPRNNGITLLMSHLLLKGTRHRTADRIADEIESLGGSIDSFGGNHSFGVSAEVMAEDFARGLELVADVLLNPAFPPAEFERERNVQLAGIRARRDQVLQTGFAAMRRALFGPAAYGLDNLGTIDSVSALTLRDLPAHHHRLAHPRNCVLAIFGDVDAEEVRNAVERTFGEWEKSPTAMDPLPGIPDQPVSSRVTEFLDKKQAVVVAGYRGTRLQQDDRYALDLLQEACSDLGSRLFLRIREELGLAYYVGAQHFPGLLPGYFAFYAGTAPENAALVEQEILRETSFLAKEGLSDVELNRAKAKWLGERMISRQDLGHLALTTALDELNGLGYQHVDREDQIVRNLTADQVRAASALYLTPDRQAIAIVQPDAGARA
jgi:zinc protease